MLSFRIFKTNISIAFSFFAIVAILILFDKTNYAMLGLIACILHELGHITAMCFFCISPKRIIFYGAGIKIVPDFKKTTTIFQDYLILLSGSMTNFIVFITLYSLSMNNFVIALFSVINLVIGAFNLIPFKHFDGGRIIDLILISNSSNPIRIRKVIRVISIIMLIILGIFFAYLQYGNFSLYLTIGYIIFSELML